MMSDYFNNLPDIEFVDEKTETTEKRMIANYEKAANRKLYPADPIAILLKSIAAEFSQTRAVINTTGKQNLLKYARDGYIENIAALSGTDRIEAKKATTKLKFTISAPQAFNVTIPAGTRATAGDGIYFATLYDSVILEGTTISNEIDAECTVTGDIGNGYMPGQINQITDRFIYAKTVENTTETVNGAGLEDIENYRERIRISPEEYSTAGPEGAYISYVKKAHQNISDVYVGSNSPSIVEIIPLMANGEMPTEEILNDIQTYLSPKSVRPLTDKVVVNMPEIVSYNIDLTYYISKSNENYAASIQTAVTNAVNSFVAWQKEKLGRAINTDELIFKLRQAGAYKVEITSPIYTNIEYNQVAIAETINITYGGILNNV